MKPVAKNNLIGDQFFLTKQSANLMEDFAREIKKGSSLFLLYGVSSVGKSRLLEELSNRGVSDHNFCWINFKSNIEANLADKLSVSDEDHVVDEIKELMEVADERDVILADHFELASNKAKHQLFQSWATDGVDKKINLVIATTTGNFSEVKQLAQQYKTRIKSFQLMPCSMAEVEAFLSFYLFPNSPLNLLSFPAGIKKQLRSCNGILGKVIEVAEQHGKQISIRPDSGSESKNYPLFTTASLLIILLAIGLSYPYWPARVSGTDISTRPTQKTITIISDNEDVVSINQTEAGQSITGDAAGQSPDQPQIAEEKPEVTALSELESGIVDNNATIENLPVEPETTQVESELVNTDESEELLVGDNKKPLNRFQRDLADTQKWIKSLDKSRATIQIMTIVLGNVDGKAYHRYLDNLVSKNVDISGIRIYQTTINDSVAYGVIYGDYENRREANKNIQQLPQALNAKQPIPRTIDGIWNEINDQ